MCIINACIVHHMQYYRVSVQDCTFGNVTAKNEYKERSNFSVELDTFVDGQNAGYFVWVTRKSDNQRK